MTLRPCSDLYWDNHYVNHNACVSILHEYPHEANNDSSAVDHCPISALPDIKRRYLMPLFSYNIS